MFLIGGQKFTYWNAKLFLITKVLTPSTLALPIMNTIYYFSLTEKVFNTVLCY